MLSACLRRKGTTFTQALDCRQVTVAEQCFGSVPDAATMEALQECLVAAGCGTPELASATEMAAYVLGTCQDEENTTAREKNRLGRRRPLSLSDVDRHDTVNDGLHIRATTTTDGSTATAAATSDTTDTTATTATTTTDIDTTGTATTDTTATTATSTTAATTTGTTTTSLVCSTEKETSVTSCDATSTYDCSLVATTTSVCVDGLYCTTDTAGNHLCMVEQDGLTTSGAIVTIILAVILAAIIGTISTLCIRDRVERKRRHAKLQAAAIAKEGMATEPLLREGPPKIQYSFEPTITPPEHAPEPSSSRNPFSG